MMDDLLMARLAVAKTIEDRTWAVTESLLNRLSLELSSVVRAAAIPHWFNADILRTLCPEINARAPQLYANLQQLPFVEVFPGRGHNIHELTRKVMLDHLWIENPDEFRELSASAAEFFSTFDEPEAQIESVYHLMVSDPTNAADKLWDLGVALNNTFSVAEVATLSRVVYEHLESRRVTGRSREIVLFWKRLSEQGASRTQDVQTTLQLELSRQESLRLNRHIEELLQASLRSNKRLEELQHDSQSTNDLTLLMTAMFSGIMAVFSYLTLPAFLANLGSDEIKVEFPLFARHAIDFGWIGIGLFMISLSATTVLVIMAGIRIWAGRIRRGRPLLGLREALEIKLRPNSEALDRTKIEESE